MPGTYLIRQDFFDRLTDGGKRKPGGTASEGAILGTLVGGSPTQAAAAQLRPVMPATAHVGSAPDVGTQARIGTSTSSTTSVGYP